MKIVFNHHGFCYRCRTSDARSIAIELDFEQKQPNFFHAPAATRTPLVLGGWVGSTVKGGGCNVDAIQIIPHCNGTHTETISHVVSAEVPIGRAGLESLMLAQLITVNPIPVNETLDSYRPPLNDGDWVIDRSAMEPILQTHRKQQPSALIIRTSSNQIEKNKRNYSKSSDFPFFTIEAMELICELGVAHLLVDFPSVDCMYDEGKLTNHRIFWNLPNDGHEMTGDCCQEKTITEMIYVDDAIHDGLVLLNLQIPCLRTDAAPSRPVIWEVEEIDESLESRVLSTEY